MGFEAQAETEAEHSLLSRLSSRSHNNRCVTFHPSFLLDLKDALVNIPSHSHTHLITSESIAIIR